MISTETVPRRVPERLAALGTALAPETGLVLVLCAAGWAAMLAGHASPTAHGAAMSMGGHGSRAGAGGWVAGFASWAAMTLAMVPAAAHAMARRVATRSLRRRRIRSVLLFLGSHWGAWLVAGAACLPIASLLRVAFDVTFATVAAAVALGAWLVSPHRRWALRRCHASVALRISGAGADADAARFGLVHGARCVVACVPLMMLATVGHAGVLGMAAATWAMFAERRRIDPSPWASLAAGAVVVAFPGV